MNNIKFFTPICLLCVAIFMTKVSHSQVGIGTTTPQGDLQIDDRLVIDAPDNTGWGRIANNSYWDYNDVSTNNPKRVVDGFVAECGLSNTGDLMFRTAENGNANSVVNFKLNMLVKNNGGVGINTWTIPAGYELAVDGKIIATEIKVRPSNYWPDYVFKTGYKLQSLEEVENYIDTNGHLPNIPKAEIIEKEGYHVGEMDIKLLEKIEELTIYAIDADKEIKHQQQQIDDLTQLVQELQKMINK